MDFDYNPQPGIWQSLKHLQCYNGNTYEKAAIIVTTGLSITQCREAVSNDNQG